MKTLIFIHGGESFATEEEYQIFLRETYISWQSESWTPEEKKSWTQEIAKKWYARGDRVYMPAFPNKLDAKYEEWKIVFEGILAKLTPDHEITLIGGSLGGCFLLKYFSDIDGEHLYFVIPKNEESLLKASDENLMSKSSEFQEKGMSSIGQKGIHISAIHLVAACIETGDFTRPMNYDTLQTLGNRVHIWHAEDDQIVPISVGRELSEILPHAETHFFSSEKGYGHFYGLAQFPELEGILFSR